MIDQAQLSSTSFLAHDRVGELHLTAHEIHGPSKPHRVPGQPGQPGPVQRIRATVGRRLVSLGSTMAGHHA
jgi:hypothetical protein